MQLRFSLKLAVWCLLLVWAVTTYAHPAPVDPATQQVPISAANQRFDSAAQNRPVQVQPADVPNPDDVQP